MRRRLPSLVILAGLGLAAWPVIGEPADAPRALLPDTLGPAPAAPAEPPPPAEAAPVEAAPPPVAETPATDAAGPAAPSAFDLPAATGRAIYVAGPLTPAMGGYGAAAFDGADGRFVAALMHRVATPLASRWGHIVLRRALLSEVPTPADIAPADWIAWRAALLLRLGEVDGAVLLVDAVAVDRYSPQLYRVAGQVHLAAADLAGLCPIAQTGAAVSQDPLWRLAVGMCGGMAGDDLTSAATFDALRGRRTVDPFDVRLGERVAALSGGTGRAPRIEWQTAPVLTPYRFGVALAAGVRVPPERLAGVNPGWVLRAPGVDDAARLAAALPAAARGVASAAELVSTISTTAGDNDTPGAIAPTLRAAFAAAALDDRYAALKALHDTPGDPAVRYAALLAAAAPAARLRPDAARAGDAPGVIAALLAGGDEGRAAAWWRAVQGDAAARARAWGLLAASGRVPVDAKAFVAWRGEDGDAHRARLLLAGLDGLGATRGDWSAARRDLGLTPLANSWSRALAAARGPGEVAVLAATGMQCGWAAMPPAQLGAIVAAYNRVGLGREARLLVAEAVTRG